MSNETFQWIVAIAVILACISFLVQAVAVLALLRIVKALQGRLMPFVDSARPVVETARRILEDNRPRIAELSTEAVYIAKSVRAQVERIGELVQDTSSRARQRIAQIDRTVDHTVEQVEHAGTSVKNAMLKPVREVNAILAGMRAAIAAYASGNRPSVDHATTDEEMFI